MLYTADATLLEGIAAEENEQQRVTEDDPLPLPTDNIPSEGLDHLLILPGGE